MILRNQQNKKNLYDMKAELNVFQSLSSQFSLPPGPSHLTKL